MAIKFAAPMAVDYEIVFRARTMNNCSTTNFASSLVVVKHTLIDTIVEKTQVRIRRLGNLVCKRNCAAALQFHLSLSKYVGAGSKRSKIATYENIIADRSEQGAMGDTQVLLQPATARGGRVRRRVVNIFTHLCTSEFNLKFICVFSSEDSN